MRLRVVYEIMFAGVWQNSLQRFDRKIAGDWQTYPSATELCFKYYRIKQVIRKRIWREIFLRAHNAAKLFELFKNLNSKEQRTNLHSKSSRSNLPVSKDHFRASERIRMVMSVQCAWVLLLFYVCAAPFTNGLFGEEDLIYKGPVPRVLSDKICKILMILFLEYRARLLL